MADQYGNTTPSFSFLWHFASMMFRLRGQLLLLYSLHNNNRPSFKQGDDRQYPYYVYYYTETYEMQNG